MSESPGVPATPSKNIILLGWVSLLNDLGSEALSRLVPIFVGSVLAAPMSAVGTIEGIAEAAATLLKPVFGRWSDRVRQRKAFVIWGYALSAMARPFLAVIGSWPEVAFLRFCDRSGKGVRTAPRDALIADSSISGRHGRHFGINQAMDTVGALLGVGILALWVWKKGEHALTMHTWRILVLFCSVPGFVAVAITIAAVREAVSISGKYDRSAPRPRQRLSGGLRRYFAAVAVFALANSSDGFILLRAKELGYSLAGILGLVALLNVVSSLTAIPAATLSDRMGRRALIATGWGIYAISYGLIGSSAVRGSTLVFAATLAIYGLFYGFTDSVERAWIADLASQQQRGRAYGVFGLITGLVALPASAGFGWIWDRYGSRTAFLTGSAIAWLATAILFILTSPAEDSAVADNRDGDGKRNLRAGL